MTDVEAQHAASTMTNDKDIEGFDQWAPSDLAAYLSRHGLGAYSELVIKHKISGLLVPLLQDADLKDMGIQIVGDRLWFRQLMSGISRKARFQHRNRPLWTGKEQLHFHCFQQCCATCCGCCPDDPSKYKLTATHLVLNTVDPCRCFCLTLPCGKKTYSNNIDLTHVEDVDVQGIPPPCLLQTCCCASGKDMIVVSVNAAQASGESRIYLILRQGQGQTVSQLILNQVEESQVMERT